MPEQFFPQPGVRRRQQVWGELRALWHLAWPILIGQLATVGMAVADVAMTGHYSAADLAGVSLGVSVWNMVIITIMGIMMAINPIERAQMLKALASETTEAIGAPASSAHERQLRSMTRLIDDMLDISRIQHGKRGAPKRAVWLDVVEITPDEETLVESMGIEVPTATGTSQGKVKRPDGAAVRWPKVFAPDLQRAPLNDPLRAIECRRLARPTLPPVNWSGEARFRVRAEIQAGMPMLQTDTLKIKQIVVNLLSNAVKYNHPGGGVEPLDLGALLVLAGIALGGHHHHRAGGVNLVAARRAAAGDVVGGLAGDDGGEALRRAQGDLQRDLARHGSAEQDGLLREAPGLAEAEDQLGVEVHADAAAHAHDHGLAVDGLTHDIEHSAEGFGSDRHGNGFVGTSYFLAALESVGGAHCHGA